VDWWIGGSIELTCKQMSSDSETQNSSQDGSETQSSSKYDKPTTSPRKKTFKANRNRRRRQRRAEKTILDKAKQFFVKKQDDEGVKLIVEYLQTPYAARKYGVENVNSSSYDAKVVCALKKLLADLSSTVDGLRANSNAKTQILARLMRDLNLPPDYLTAKLGVQPNYIAQSKFKAKRVRNEILTQLQAELPNPTEDDVEKVLKASSSMFNSYQRGTIRDRL
jgi:hypothetical protein